MENENKMAPVVVIDGAQYDVANATEQTAALIQDLVTVQSELNRLKTSYDITNIARATLLEGISKLIQKGESGLVEIKTEQEEAATTEGEVA